MNSMCILISILNIIISPSISGSRVEVFPAARNQDDDFVSEEFEHTGSFNLLALIYCLEETLESFCTVHIHNIQPLLLGDEKL